MSKPFVRLVMALVCAGFALGATAQTLQKVGSYPDRPLSIIVPAGPGGGSDQVSRAMAGVLPDIVGVPVQVINKPGGGALTAVVDYMTMPHDGYPILQHADLITSSYFSLKLNVDLLKDLEVLAIVQVTFSQLYIRSDETRFHDWDSFLAYARASKKPLTLANIAQPESMERINELLLEKAVGFETTQISFDKPAERYAALVGGHVDLLFEQPGDVRQFIEAGTFKPILTFQNSRPSAFADVPCLNDVGADFKPLFRYRGFWVHADAPAERKKFLAEAMKRGFDTPAFQAFNRKKYMHLARSYYGPEDGTQLIKDSIATLKAAAEKAAKSN